MTVTQFSIVLFPLCLIYALNPQRLLQLILIAGLFNAAAAVVLGGFGVQPSLIPSLLFIAYTMLQLLLGVHYTGSRYIWRSAGLFVAVTVFATLTAFLLPRMFAGTLQIWPQKVSVSFTGVETLQPSFSNVTQCVYLIIDCAVLVTTALLTTRPGIRFDKLLNTYLLGAWLVVAISVWQLASKVAGVPFADSFFYSNPGWTIWTSQQLGSVPRINGPFAEPASLASYLVGVIFACVWLILRGHRSRSARYLLPAALLTLVLSTSTTGFAALGVGAALLVLYALTGAPRAMVARMIRFSVPAILLLGVLGFSVSVLAPSVVNSVAEVVDATMSKGDSSSYDDRTTVDTDSLDMVMQTGGLGVGWGSNRSSSLVPGLLSNIGVVGVVLILCFGWALTRQVRAARRVTRDASQALLLDGFLISILGQLIAAIISAPSIEAPDFFVQLGLLIGCSAKVSVDAAKTRRVARTMRLAARQQVPGTAWLGHEQPADANLSFAG